jgi:transposase
MIDLNHIDKIFICNGFTDLRKGIDGYIAIIDGVMKKNVFDNAIFIFCNKQKDKIKIIHYEINGVWLYYKRFDDVRIQWPKGDESSLEITKEQVKILLLGLSLELKRTRYNL